MVLLGLTTANASAAVITGWSFTATQAAPYNSPPATTGTGTATMLGMTNSYNGGLNVASGDIVASSGVIAPPITEDTWRIRGAGANGWATHAAGAAQYTQGIELDTSTVGFQNIGFSFDWYATTSGIRDLQVQYNTNTANPAGWTNVGGTSPTGTYLAVANDFYATSSPNIQLDLSSIAGANNDATFGIRLVSAYDSTGNVPSDYASATLLSGKTQIYNNSSGNWRFDNLAFSGTPVTTPEPASLSFAGLGGMALLSRRRKIAG